MLPKPPCITGFIECDPGNTSRTGINIPPYQSSNGSVAIPPYQSSNGSVAIPPYQSSNGSVTIPPYRSSRGSFRVPRYNSSDGSLTIPSYQSSDGSFNVPSANASAGNRDLFAVYDVTLRNPLRNPLKGLRLEHGPIPFGATFDPGRSGKSCSLLQKIVGCTRDLGPSERKEFPIVYRITNPAFCRLSPVLQSIRTVFANATNTAAPAEATVQCRVMKGEDLDRELATKKALEDAKERAMRDPRSVYTVSLKNLGSKALKNMSVTHGPIPPGHVFDPSRSDSRCKESNGSVICTQDLAAKQSKEFQITYKIEDGSTCATTPILQSVQTSLNASTVSSKVHCKDVVNGEEAGSASSAQSAAAGGKGFLAEYTVTMKNLGKKIENGLIATQGPVPSDAIFDSALSSKTCSFLKGNISCKQALHSGEQKSFKITYGVSDPSHCESFAELKNIALSYEGSDATPPVSAWVQCTTRISDPSEGLNDNIPLPETGNDNGYYLSTEAQELITTKREMPSDPFSMTFLILSGLSILIIGIATIMKFPQKSGLKAHFIGRF